MATERLKLYDNDLQKVKLENPQEIIDYHTAITTKYELPSTYLSLKDTLKRYEDYSRGFYNVIVAPFSSLDPEDRATFIHSTIQSYILHGTFGNFPISDDKEYEDLTAVMISGFSEDTMVVAVKDKENGQHIGGCLVVPGKGKKLIGDTVGSGLSTLSTLQALNFEINDKSLANTAEEEAIVFSRFHRLPQNHIEGITSDYLKQFSMEVLSGMGRAVEHHQKERGVEYQYGILDTHDPNVVFVLEKYYAGKELTKDTLATDLVLKSPLHWHYDIANHKGNISVIYFSTKDQIKAAHFTDRILRPKLPRLNGVSISPIIICNRAA